MFEIVHFSINIISKTCTVVFNELKVQKNFVDMLELVHYSIKIISKTCTIVFNVPKV